MFLIIFNYNCSSSLVMAWPNFILSHITIQIVFIFSDRMAHQSPVINDLLYTYSDNQYGNLASRCIYRMGSRIKEICYKGDCRKFKVTTRDKECFNI